MFAKMLIKLLEYVVMLTFGTLVVLSFIQVLSRYIFSSSFTWFVEFSRYLLVWLTLMGACIVTARNEHISIGSIFDKIMPKQKNLFRMAVNIGICTFLSIILIQGIFLSWELRDYGTSSMPWLKMGYVFSVVPISCVIMLILYINSLYIDIKKLRKKRRRANKI